MKVESILAKLNDLRKDCKGEEEIEDVNDVEVNDGTIIE